MRPLDRAERDGLDRAAVDRRDQVTAALRPGRERAGPPAPVSPISSLERDGLVDRQGRASVPPAVTYQLTPLGRTPLEPMAAVRAWAWLWSSR